jgi:hypothetical protein
MVTVFWDGKGVLRVEFMPQGTIMSQVYCVFETQVKLFGTGSPEQKKVER